MKVLLLQLSDIHLRLSHPNPVTNRAQQIVDAVRNVAYDLDLCVLVLSGDVAYSGRTDEYLAAADLIGAIELGLATALRGRPPVRVVGVPGNHDCCLIPELPGRTALIGDLLRQERPVPQESIIAECTSVQDAFFSFLEVVTHEGSRTGDRLSYQYEFRCGDEVLRIQCYNTAWLSQLKEQPGRLYFPVEAMPDARPDASAVVSVFHHPYNWLPASGNHREFRRRVVETSDVVLTGHEHEPDLYQSSGPHGASTFVECAALQGHGEGEVSGFNAVVLDTGESVQKVLRYAWDGERYAEGEGSGGWEPFWVRARGGGVFEPSPEMEARLDDLELTIQHPASGTVRLSQVFVYPDIEEMGALPSTTPRTFPGETLVTEILRRKAVVITGPEKSGKSALAKSLFRAFHEAGYVPLLLEGRKLTGRPTRINEELDTLVRQQYGYRAVDPYRQLDCSRRVLIVDDSHRLHQRIESMSELLYAFTQASDHVVLIANDLVQSLAEATRGGRTGVPLAQFDHLMISQFGHLRRHQLTERWLMLDPSLRDHPQLFARKLLEAKRTTDMTIGKNFIPSYPVFLLPLLLAYAENQQVDLSASTYGYYYELLIKRSLFDGQARQEDLDIRIAYLTFLAAEMFRAGEVEISDVRFRTIHGEYERRHLLELPYAKLQNDLVRKGVLSEIEGSYRFRYKYIYYYFVARHLADTIHKADTQAIVSQMCAELHSEEAANLLLFLAHLSKHESIVGGMLQQAARMFAEFDPATLKGDAAVFPEVQRAYEELAYTDRPAVEHQRALMRSEDERTIEAAAAARPSPAALAAAVAQGRDITEFQAQMDAVHEGITRFATAIKTLQILGQTVKNFPGRFEASEKLEVVGSTYEVGLRCLEAMHRYIHAHTDEIVQGLRETGRETDPYVPDHEIIRSAAKKIHSLLHMCSFGLVRRVVLAVGSRQLKPVYDALRGAEPTPAQDLIHIALVLEQFSDRFPLDEVEKLAERFKETDPMAYQVLRHLVYNHFHLFEVEFGVKQRVCTKLGISFTDLRQISPDRKLLRRAAS